MSQLTTQRGEHVIFSMVVKNNGVPVDLTGASLAFHAATQLAVAGVGAIDKTTAGGGIVIDPDQVANRGKLTVELLSADTALFPSVELNLYYTLTLTLGGDTYAADEGILIVVPRMYVTLSDVRGTGLDETIASDDQVRESIITWQHFIERVTRQWFYPMESTFSADGTDSDTLHFSIPIISVSELKINDSVNALDPTYYKVYNNLGSHPDDRKNPRIQLVDTLHQGADIYTAPLRFGSLIFRKGNRNRITGVFGYVEPDGSAPPLIRRALLKLVIEKLSKPLYGSSTATPPHIVSGIVTEEWTDGHRLKYATSGGDIAPRAPGLSGITSDPEIQQILRLYKAPIGMATPAHPSYR